MRRGVSTDARTPGRRLRRAATAAVIATVIAGLGVAGTQAAHAAGAPIARAGIVPAAESAPIVHSGTEYTYAPGTVYYVPAQVTVGEPIHISGSGWKNTAGDAGSVIGFKLDEGGVSTTAAVTNPATGQVQGNKTIFGIVQAGADGDWQIDLPWPTADNSTAAWGAGETHSVRMLTGSLLTGDVARTAAGEFATVAADAGGDGTGTPGDGTGTPGDGTGTPGDGTGTPGDGTGTPGDADCADGGLRVSDAAGGQTAVACVQQSVSTGAGATIAVTGSGWLTTDATAGATVVVKLTSRTAPDASDFQFVHTGASGDTILDHPANGTPDATMWALVRADADGTFRATMPVPTAANAPANIGSAGALKAGSKLVVHFQTGVLAADTGHSFDSPPLVVDGQAYAGDQSGEIVPCTATGPAEAHLEAPEGTDPNTGPVVSFGGTVRLVGTGWCNNDSAKGGSTVAIKFDEGAFSHRPSEIVNANAQIWQIVPVDSADGSFSVDVAVPQEGDAAGGTAPVFTTGTHTLRLLTGSLKVGDPIRSVLTGPFTVGQYQPNGAPDPMDPATLTDANRAGVDVTLTATELVVTVPGAHEGDWIFVTPFDTDGSPRYPWLARWSQADAAGVVRLPLAGATLPVGTIKVAVQSGDPGRVGTVRGWGWLTVAAPAQETPVIAAPAPAAAAPAAAKTVPVLASVVPTATLAPTTVPPVPFATDEGLTAANVGGLTAVQDGTVVTITAASANPGDWVYVYAYSTPVPVGWIQVDAQRQVRVDVKGLPAGTHKVVLLDEDGGVIGWVGAVVAGAKTAAASTSSSSSSSGEAAAETSVAAVHATTPAATGLSTADWALMGGAAGLVLAMLAIALVLRRRSARPAAAPADGAPANGGEA